MTRQSSLLASYFTQAARLAIARCEIVMATQSGLCHKEVTMFAGHVGAAIAIGRTERRLNVGIFVIAALLLDILLWIFILLGWESVSIQADFNNTHQPEFIFPYSHSLLAGVLWSVLAGAVALPWLWGLNEIRWRAAALIAAAVFSHWLLDAVVHVPELPLTGAGSRMLGLGLWQSMPVALLVEALIVVQVCGFFFLAVLYRAAGRCHSRFLP